MSDGDDFVSTLGGLEIDWPRTVGYYGAIAVAVAFEVIAPPLGLFIAAVPLFGLLKRRHASRAEKFAAAIIEGASKPVGGDADAVVRLKWVGEKEEEKQRAAAAPRQAPTVAG